MVIQVKKKQIMVPRLLGLFLCFFTASVFAQVPATINVSDCGTSTTLNSTTIPGYSSLIWDNGSTSTSRTVNASGAYWWQVTGANVVSNGDFSSGNSSFTSEYTYRYVGQNGLGNLCCGVLSAEGTYAVDNNPRDVHGNFSSFTDHTNGAGNMLIVNGSPTNNQIVWTQNIPIIANTDYVFSVWVTSASPANPAQLQFSIAGNNQLGTTIIPAGTADGTWQFFTTTWNSGSISGNSIPIALVNKNIIANGNDFAIDDIAFAPVYRQNINVTLNPIPVLTLTAAAEECGVYDLTESIVGYDNATYAYVFKDSFGNVITPANASAIVQSGVYTITAQNRVTGCTSLPQQTTVTINPNPQKPGISPL